MTADVQRGVCRYCGCREGSPCSLCRAKCDDCAWLTKDQTVCAGEPCVRADAERKARNKKPKPKSRFAGMEFGAICEVKRREERRARRSRGKGKAA